jgi:hypothetical protein
MQIIAEDEEVFVEYDDWVNKSLSRTEIRIYLKSGDDWNKQNISTTYCVGLTSYEILEKLLPWAKFEASDDTYDDDSICDWDDEPTSVMSIKKCHFDRREKSRISRS